MQALANARVQERLNEERILNEEVSVHLGIYPPRIDRSLWPVWLAYCANNRIDAYPAVPAAVAVFVLNKPNGVEKIVETIGAVHTCEGKADPTLSPVVVAALAKVLPPIKAPRSWPADHKQQFNRMPRDLQQFVAEHHRKIELEMRRAQNAAAKAKKDDQHGNTRKEPTPAAGTDRTDAGTETA
jgi:hypothetical protein